MELTKVFKSTLKEKNIEIHVFSALKKHHNLDQKIKEITSQDFQFVPDSLSLRANNISSMINNQGNSRNNRINSINTGVLLKIKNLIISLIVSLT